MPRGHSAHIYRETIKLRMTDLSRDQSKKTLDDLQKIWQGRTYNILHRNCCHFVHEFCDRLGTGDAVPAWLNRLARIGGTVDKILTDGWKKMFIFILFDDQITKFKLKIENIMNICFQIVQRVKINFHSKVSRRGLI